MAKWHLSSVAQKKSTSDLLPAQAVVEVPALLSLRALGSGQRFPVSVSLDGGVSFETKDALLIGDGRSLLWGDRVVPLPASVTSLRKAGHFRFGVGPYAQRVHLALEAERAVKAKGRGGASAGGTVKAPMTGKVVSVLVQEGQSVAEGDALLTIEAMKMENRILADWPGIVRQIKAQAGAMATLGEALLTIEPAGN